MEKTTIYEMLGFALAFLGIGIAYYAVHFGIRLEKTKRELEHKERMMALELGRSLPGDFPRLSPVRAGLLIAVAVPIGVFASAFLASLALGYEEAIWMMAGAVGISAVIGGTVVTCLGLARQPHDLQQKAVPAAKEQVEDDAYDVVSARG